MVRFQILVDERTYKALRSLSLQEYRNWRLQAGYLIREALLARGYDLTHLEVLQSKEKKNESEK